MLVEVLRSFSTPPLQPGQRVDIPDYQRALKLISQRFVIAVHEPEPSRRGRPPKDRQQQESSLLSAQEQTESEAEHATL